VNEDAPVRTVRATERRLATVASSLLYEAKTIVAARPSIAIPIANARGHGEVISDDTEIVIEGFPRSANSFAVAAFRMAQEREINIAHHTHAPAQILIAARRNIPALVLIRDPADACVGLAAMNPKVSLIAALRGYVRFYEPLIPLRSSVVVATFQEATTDLGEVISRINVRYGTHFVPFDHTPANVEACFAEMETFWRGQVGDATEVERVVGRPSAARDATKKRLRAALGSPRERRVLTEARRLFTNLVDQPADRQP
jgi:hypothetical protein